MTANVPVSRRALAVIALGSLAALCLAVVLIFFRHADNLLLGLLGVFIAVTGGWWVVTEHMPRRAVGAAGLVVGVVVIGGTVARAYTQVDGIVLRDLALAALLAATLVCAHRAMIRDPNRLEVRVRSGGPPRRAVLLCNPRSGGGKVEQFGLVDLAATLGVETVLLRDGLDLEQLARAAVARGADCLGMAGGDGSQALVASIAVEHGLPFVCVSAGTRNHFALDLGLNRDDPRESMYAFRDAIERQVDYATVNGRVFVNNVSLGVYAEIVSQDSYRDAKVQTTAAVLPDVLGRRSEPFDLQFTTPDGRDVDGAILVMVSNNPYVIGASPDNAQRRHLDSGTLGVFAVTTKTGSEAALLIAASALGQRRRSPFWHEFAPTSFEVRSHSGVAAGIDGEALELDTPLRFEIHPRELTVLVPESSVEVARAREARDFAIGDLVALAAGREPDRA